MMSCRCDKTRRDWLRQSAAMGLASLVLHCWHVDIRLVPVPDHMLHMFYIVFMATGIASSIVVWSRGEKQAPLVAAAYAFATMSVAAEKSHAISAVCTAISLAFFVVIFVAPGLRRFRRH